MKRLLFLFATLPSLALCEGPRFRHKEPTTEQEFQNVYQDLRTVLASSGSARCIDAPTLCVDTVNDRVWIDNQLFISSNTNDAALTQQITDAVAGLGIAGTGTRFMLVNFSADSGQRVFRIRWDSGVLKFGSLNDGATADVAADIMNMSYSGAVSFDDGPVTKTLQPSFYVTIGSSVNITGDSSVWTASFDTEITDRAGNFNTTTYTFTAPVGGDYLLCASLGFDGFSAGPTLCRLRIQTSNQSSVVSHNPGSATSDSLSFCHVRDMDANDTAFVTLQVDGGTKAVDLIANAQNNQFSGTLLN